MDEMVIRKDTVRVELCSSHGALSRGEVFLRSAGDSSARGERLLDVLAERWFVPLKTPERIVFVATRHIAWARIDLLAAVDELDPEAEDDEASCTARVLVELEDGGKIEGDVRYALPPSTRRLGDYLERLPSFFPVRTDDWLYLVSSVCVSSVTPIEENR
ncbi:MAG TPA: hypothetical protein VGO62_16475 [Myxococcota bacterium]